MAHLVKRAKLSALVRPTLLEHLNLNIPSEATAREFYVDGLGGVVNPRSSNARQLHINMGASQFHLLHRLSVRGMEPVDVGQVWAGHVELWTTEDLAEVQARLPSGSATLSPEGDDAVRLLRVRCPWGNRLEVRRAPTDFAPPGGHPGGCGQLVGMPRLVHFVRPGAAAHLFAFWTGVLRCEAALEAAAVGSTTAANGAPPVAEAADAGAARCTVCFESGQRLVFEEREDAPPHDAYDADPALAEYHLALYLPTASSFQGAFDAAAAAGLLFANPRFEGGPPEFASALTWEEAEEAGQFRVKDLRGPAAGDEVGLVLELEVRAPTHVSCPLGREQ